MQKKNSNEEKRVITRNNNSFNAFCSINNIEQRLPKPLIDMIGSFFIPTKKIRDNCITKASQRNKNLQLQQLFIEFQPNNPNFLVLCKAHLLNGAEFIGPRNRDVKFCIENIGNCFVNETSWPSEVQALIYLQVFIQKETSNTYLSIALAIKNQCLGKEDDTVFIIDKKSFLGEIYTLCQKSGLIALEEMELDEEKNESCILM